MIGRFNLNLIEGRCNAFSQKINFCRQIVPKLVKQTDVMFPAINC